MLTLYIAILSLSVLKYKVLHAVFCHKESYEDPISKLRILISVQLLHTGAV